MSKPVKHPINLRDVSDEQLIRAFTDPVQDVQRDAAQASPIYQYEFTDEDFVRGLTQAQSGIDLQRRSDGPLPAAPGTTQQRSESVATDQVLSNRLGCTIVTRGGRTIEPEDPDAVPMLQYRAR